MRGATRVKRRLTHTALISTHTPHARCNAKMATFISHKNEAYGIVLNTKGNTYRTQIIISPYNMIKGFLIYPILCNFVVGNGIVN